MTWLTWRQFRVHAAVLYGALLALAAALALTGPHLADVYSQSADTFLAWVSGQNLEQNLYTVGTIAGYAVPALLGVFWGAPMVAREVEAGTHRLVWTQSITRTRWLATKLGFGLLAAGTAGGLVGLAMTWWSHPIDAALEAGASDTGSVFSIGRLAPAVFATRGVVPIGYAVVAFALGVLVGALVRRTVPAMAVALAAYVALQVAMPIWVRPHLVAPAQETTPIEPGTLHGIRGSGPNGPINGLEVAFDEPGAWVLSSRTVDADGNTVDTFPSWVVTCLPTPGTEQAQAGAREQGCFDKLTSLGYGQHVTYHPASHYWPLQWRETGVLVTGSLVLVGLTFWRVRRLS